MKAQINENKVKLYTGSYNAPILTGDGDIYQGKGKGIQVFGFDEEDGTLEKLECYPDIENASWLSFSPDRKTLYAVNELDDYQGTGGGALSALAVDEDGKLAIRNCLPVMGAAPCHVDCDRSGGHVFTANYNGGNVSSFEVNQDGSLKGLDFQITYHMDEDRRMQGINELRQEKPHVHSTSVFNGYLWVSDLGMDEISVYKLDERGKITGETENAQFKPCSKVTLPAGKGPRSLAFGKEGFVYVSCELSNEIGILHWERSRVKLEGFVPCTPKVQKENFPGGIRISADGRYLYIGNRGHDSIAVFKIGEHGFLESIQWIPSGGENPRGLQLSPSGRWLIAANQSSDNIVIFGRDEETGMLTEHARHKAGTVVCLEFCNFKTDFAGKS